MPTVLRSDYFPACIPRSFAQALALLRRSLLYGAVNRKLNRPFSISNVSPPCPSSSVCLHRPGYYCAYVPSRFFKSVLWVCTSMMLLCSSKKMPVVFCRLVSPVRMKPPGFSKFSPLLETKRKENFSVGSVPTKFHSFETLPFDFFKLSRLLTDYRSTALSRCR